MKDKLINDVNEDNNSHLTDDTETPDSPLGDEAIAENAEATVFFSAEEASWSQAPAENTEEEEEGIDFILCDEEVEEEAEPVAESSAQPWDEELELEEEESIEIDEDLPTLALQSSSFESQLSFDEKVLEKIVTEAVKEVDGVLISGGGGGFFNLNTRKGVKIEVDADDAINVDLDVILEYGRSAPEVFEQLKIILKERMSLMTGLELKTVNVHVSNIFTSQEFADKS